MKEVILTIAAVLAIPALILFMVWMFPESRLTRDNTFIEVSSNFNAQACAKTKGWHTLKYDYNCISLEGLK